MSKRHAILQAATRLMISEGLKRVTHRQVAAAAGVPVGSIGYYYSSREHLIEVCLEKIHDQRTALLTERVGAVSAAATPEELADSVIEAICLGRPADLQGHTYLCVDAAREENGAGGDSTERTSGPTARVGQIISLTRDLFAAAGRPNVDGRRVIEAVAGAIFVASHLGDDPRAVARRAVVDLVAACE